MKAVVETKGGKVTTEKRKREEADASQCVKGDSGEMLEKEREREREREKERGREAERQRQRHGREGNIHFLKLRQVTESREITAYKSKCTSFTTS
jgi:hypothetical protein